jgi:putative acyl-CoA dehydrogenase
MRQAVAQATHHAAYRQAFGHRLLDQALMQNVLADLAIESEAATILAMRLARACDQAETKEHENRIKRLGTAVSKYWVTKRGLPTLPKPWSAWEAMGTSRRVLCPGFIGRLHSILSGKEQAM